MFSTISHAQMTGDCCIHMWSSAGLPGSCHAVLPSAPVSILLSAVSTPLSAVLVLLLAVFYHPCRLIFLRFFASILCSYRHFVVSRMEVIAPSALMPETTVSSSISLGALLWQGQCMACCTVLSTYSTVPLTD